MLRTGALGSTFSLPGFLNLITFGKQAQISSSFLYISVTLSLSLRLVPCFLPHFLLVWPASFWTFFSHLSAWFCFIFSSLSTSAFPHIHRSLPFFPSSPFESLQFMLHLSVHLHTHTHTHTHTHILSRQSGLFQVCMCVWDLCVMCNHITSPVDRLLY